MDKICSDVSITVRLLYQDCQGSVFMVSTRGIVLDKAHGDFGQNQCPLGFLHLSLGGCRASRIHPEAMGCRGCRTSLLLKDTKQR